MRLTCESLTKEKFTTVRALVGFGKAGIKHVALGGGTGTPSSGLVPPPRQPQSLGSSGPMMSPLGSVAVIPSHFPMTQDGRLRQGAAPMAATAKKRRASKVRGACLMATSSAEYSGGLGSSMREH